MVRGGGKHFLEVYSVICGRCHLSQICDIKKKKKCMRDESRLPGLAAGLTWHIQNVPGYITDAIEAGPQNYKAPLWVWPWLASMAPAAQPVADRVNRVASTPALLQTYSTWPERQWLDLKLSSRRCSSYLWPKRWAEHIPMSLKGYLSFIVMV